MAQGSRVQQESTDATETHTTRRSARGRPFGAGRPNRSAFTPAHTAHHHHAKRTPMPSLMRVDVAQEAPPPGFLCGLSDAWTHTETGHSHGLIRDTRASTGLSGLPLRQKARRFGAALYVRCWRGHGERLQQPLGTRRPPLPDATDHTRTARPHFVLLWAVLGRFSGRQQHGGLRGLAYDSGGLHTTSSKMLWWL